MRQWVWSGVCPQRSLEDEINSTTAEDLPIFAVSYLVIFLYISLALGSYSSWRRVPVRSERGAVRVSWPTIRVPRTFPTYFLLLLLLLSRFSRVRLCATPQTVVYQAPLSPGFSRQQYFLEHFKTAKWTYPGWLLQGVMLLEVFCFERPCEFSLCSWQPTLDLCKCKVGIYIGS